MDRQIVYAGSIPLDTDLLYIQRYVQASIGALAQLIMGSTGVVDGLTCMPGSDAYTVAVGPGSYTAPLPADETWFGSLPPDPTMVMQTALQTGTTVLQLGPPPEREQVLCWLIQAAIVGQDAGAVALPYWNAGNPSIAFSGPGNTGAAQNTQRLIRVQVSCKASAPQPFPLGVPPAPDPGWVGLYGVTTFFGKAVVEASDIVATRDAPTLSFKLPALTPGASRQETFSTTTIWSAPAGVRRVHLRLVAGGGGGGGGDTNYSGGGGGAGGFSEVYVPVIPGGLYQVVIGAGGSGGAPSTSGVTGGDTDFNGLAHATGGQGGGSSNPDSHGGAPGRGVSGGLVQVGGWGGDGVSIANIPGGMGGTSAFGGGGRGAVGGGPPATGQAAGSGGGGAYGPGSYGGNGAGGLVVLDY